MTRPTYEQRIARASQLAEVYPFAREVLLFYKEIAAFQRALYADRDPTPARASLVALVARIGPHHLAEAAAQCCKDPNFCPPEHVERFLTTALWQPHKEYMAEHSVANSDAGNLPICPSCGGKPVAGVLRPEGHGAKRSLVCSTCSTEWNYPRVLCPSCGEQTFDALPVYTATEFDHIRVEACDRCRTYLKSVDLTKNGLAIPLVDELAAIPLDLWAQENGYSKLSPNLLGI